MRYATWLFRAAAWSLAVLSCGTVSVAADTSYADADSVRRGEYLATASDCVACHSAPGGKPFAGGLAISSPVGTIYSTNITPSMDFGIGRYSQAEFARAIREGVRADGANLYPAMPYTSYKVFTDEDIRDLYSYFMQGVAAAEVTPQRTALAFPMNVRLSMKGWNLLFLGRAGDKEDPARPPDWTRGRYLVQGAAHCSTCHTPRGFLMQELSGRELSGAQVGAWYAPNITSDTVSGIGSWSREELMLYLQTGALPGKAQAAGSMGEAIEHSFSHLTVEDIGAIATYIQSVPAIHDPSDDQSRFGYGKPSSALGGLRGKNAILSEAIGPASGAALFEGNCASCHSPFGQGSKDGYYPTLFHNSASGAGNSTNLIAVILNGVERTTPKGEAYMPGFGGKPNDINALSDGEIAILANYVTEHFGRLGKAISPDDVAQVRAGGPKSYLLLFARIGVAFGLVLVLAMAMAIVWWRRRKAD